MSATEELRRMLEERGVEYEVEREGKISEAVLWDGPIGTKHSAFVSNENPDKATGEILYATLFLTPEQAIAATLGSELPYDELLRCLENDWHISASWDGLRKFWCIELTEEGVKLRNSAHNTLTAEQVRDVIEVAKAELLESCEYLGDYEQRMNDVLKAFGKMEQEIAATMGGR